MERQLKSIEQNVSELREMYSGGFNRQAVSFLDKFDVLVSMSRSIRESAGMTMREVEEATGISNAYLSQLETGKVSNPSYKTIRKLFVLYYEVKEPKLKLNHNGR